MRIRIHEIKDTGLDLTFTESDAWVEQAISRVDEKIEGLASALRPKSAFPRPSAAHLLLSQVDGVVVVTGDIESSIQLHCSRCAKLFSMPVKTHFSSLFCQDPSVAGVGHMGLDENTGKMRPFGQNKGFARHAHENTGQDLDITYISNDYIDLAEVVTEQVRLEVPFQPLCKESCKGICPECGADWNTGKCACAKLQKSTPFSALKDLKL